MYNVKRQVRVVVEPPNQRKGAKNRKMVILSRKIVTVKRRGHTGRRKRGNCFVKRAKNWPRLADKRVEPTCEQWYIVPGKKEQQVGSKDEL
jgi:hypothetical protein